MKMKAALSPQMTRRDWERAFFLLMKPIVAYASAGRARIVLPGGQPSSSGSESDSLEAFARSLWMAGPWLSTHPTGTAPVGGRDVDVAAFYRDGFINGTDPRHEDSWFRLVGVDQTLVEAASLAWNLWLARGHLWDPLTPEERRRILAWFEEVAAIPPPDNNWRLFSVIVLTVLKRLGGSFHQATIDAHLDRIESFYLADGWYNDGPVRSSHNWHIDYYNALVLHPYLLYWCWLDGKSQPERRERIFARAREFQRSFVHWFGSDGSFPCFGRSTLYRMGVTHVFAYAVLTGACPLPLGQVRRLCGLVLRRALDTPGVIGSDGQLTMGFAREYLPMIESYSGPGSPYWAAKAFGVLALPSHHPFWSSPEKPLPIERTDYVLAIPAAGFLVRGHRATGQVQVVNGKSLGSSKKYSNLAYSTHFGYEIDRHRSVGAIDPFGEASLTLSRDGRRWYGRNTVRFAEVRDGVLVTEAIYRLGERRLARTAKAVSGVLTGRHPEATSHKMRSWVRARARAIYLRVAPKMTPRATVLTAVTFAGDQQVRAHRVRSRVKILVREGGFACGWDDEGEPELRAGAISYLRTLTAASGIRPLRGYERVISPLRSDHNVLHLHSGVPYVETARARRGLLRLASVSLARPAPFPAEEVGVGMDGKVAELMAMLENVILAGR